MCTDIFKSLAPNVKNMIVETFEPRSYKKGDTIIKINDPGDSFFVVREGTAHVLNSDNSMVGVLKEGDFFGEGSLLSGKPRSATITVETEPFRAFELKKQAFDKLLGPIKKVLARTNAERKKLLQMQSTTLDEVKMNCKRALGQGTFGLVKLVVLKKQAFALKVLQKKQIVSYNLVKNILYEKRMMVESDHPFVLKLVKTFQDKNCLYMLLEIVSGGELFAFLQTRGGKVPTKHSEFITACVVSVFEYIHSKDICYRDLKPENLMIDKDGYIKMVDFGFAKVVTDKTFTLCGTPEYMAPEILLRRGHNKGVDYWATGILIYECESGSTPFADYDGYDNKVICENILRKPLSYPKGMNPSAKQLIKKLLHRQPTRRYGCLARGANDIKDAPYYTTLDWNALLAKEISAPYVPPKASANGISESNFDNADFGREVIEKYTGDQGIFENF